MRLFRWLSCLAPSAVALAVAACGGSNDGNARLSVKLTDAPAQFKAAVVTITKVSLMGTGGETVLSTTATTKDLLTLANATADLVKDAVVKPGTYSELRFQISGGYIEVPAASGSGTEIFATAGYDQVPAGKTVTGTLKMPSFGTSGLKVDLTNDALELKAESKVLLVDFDVQQSFGKEAGGSGSWVMHPVIKGADITFSGNVLTTLKLGQGVSLPVITGTSMRATPAMFSARLKNLTTGSERDLAFTDAGNGLFKASFLYLLPGPYSVDVVATVGGPADAKVSLTTNPAHPASTTVGQGVDANVDFTVTGSSQP